MTNELFIKIVVSLFTLICALISAYVVPYIKSKIDVTKLAQLRTYAEFAVRCAEQIYTKEQWQNKKAYVKEYLKNVINDKLNLTLSNDDLETIIEGVVYEVKKW